MAETLPISELIEVLRQKASARQDVTFDYLGHLRNLRDQVAGEVRSINELFPEYTPHDVDYHLSRLFHVSDTLLECTVRGDASVRTFRLGLRPVCTRLGNGSEHV